MPLSAPLLSPYSSQPLGHRLASQSHTWVEVKCKSVTLPGRFPSGSHYHWTTLLINLVIVSCHVHFLEHKSLLPARLASALHEHASFVRISSVFGAWIRFSCCFLCTFHSVFVVVIVVRVYPAPMEMWRSQLTLPDMRCARVLWPEAIETTHSHGDRETKSDCGTSAQYWLSVIVSCHMGIGELLSTVHIKEIQYLNVVIAIIETVDAVHAPHSLQNPIISARAKGQSEANHAETSVRWTKKLLDFCNYNYTICICEHIFCIHLKQTD